MSFKVIINRQVKSYNLVVNRQIRSFVIRTSGVKWHSSTYTPNELDATFDGFTDSDVNDDDVIILKGKKKSLMSMVKAYVIAGTTSLYAALNHRHNYSDLDQTPQIPSIAGLASETYVNQTFEPKIPTKNSAFNVNFGTGSGDVPRGSDSRFSDSRPASDVFDWAKQSSKPTYTYSEVGAEQANPNIQTHISNSSSHVSSEDRAAWDAKQSALGFTPEAAGVAASLVSQLLNGAGTGYDTLKALENRIVAINAILGGDTPDGDNIVNKVSELLAVFSTFEEGSDIATLLSAKLNTSDVYNAMDRLLAGKALDARQGKVLSDLCDGLRIDLTNHNHAGTYEPVFSKNTAFNKNFGSTAGTVAQGDDSRFSDSRPASDVYAWAKEASKPTYGAGDVGAYTKSESNTAMGLKQDKLSFPEIPTGKVLSDDGTFKEIASSPELSMTPSYYPDGSIHTTTTSGGTKTFSWNPDGTIASIVGTGIYKSKTFNYIDGRLASTIVS